MVGLVRLEAVDGGIRGSGWWDRVVVLEVVVLEAVDGGRMMALEAVNGQWMVGLEVVDDGIRDNEWWCY